MSNDLNDIIEGALDDLGIEEDLQDSPQEIHETPSEPVQEAVTVVEETPVVAPVPEATVAEASAADQSETPPADSEDDFEKKYDFPAKNSSGRENRMPHSRVKTMVQKAEKSGYEKAVKELEGKYTPQLKEFETKVKDYETKVAKSGQLETLIDTDPRSTITVLSKHPLYKEFFEYVNKAVEAFESKASPEAQTTTASTEDPIPQPNQTLPDGSKVYDLDGVQQLLDWKARQVEKKVLKQVEDKFAKLQPIQQEWERANIDREFLAKTRPVVDQILVEARTNWPNFKELEAEIEKILEADTTRTVSLDRAYMQAYQTHVVPKLSADKNKMRAELLAEMRAKPATTAARVVPTTPSATTASQGRRPINDVIEEELRKLGL